MENDKLEKAIIRHLKKHAPGGEWLPQRQIRHALHIASAPAWNAAVCALAQAGQVDIDGTGPHRRRVIRLLAEMRTVQEMRTPQGGNPACF